MTHLPEVVLAELGPRAQALAHHLDAFLDHGDAGVVHDLRVAARRLRAALTVFAPLLVLPGCVRRQPLRRVERRAGRLRDLDVLDDLLQRHGPVEPAVAAALTWSWRMSASPPGGGRAARRGRPGCATSRTSSSGGSRRPASRQVPGSPWPRRCRTCCCRR
ncbi:MAG: CHAD domain-containing protein [Gemmatimonadetes bacterium]|nr:CHAD domain-containing protein [Gemmatimonadota bacterium]